MHILLLASYAPSLINFRGPLIRDLHSAGHQVSVGAPDISESDSTALVALGANVYQTPLQRTGQNPHTDLAYLRHLKGLIARLLPDRVLTYTIKPNVWGAHAAASENVPSYAMVTGLGYLLSESEVPLSLRKRFLRRIAIALYARATAKNRRVIFQNSDDLNNFVRVGCLSDRSKASLVNGSGVDMLHYTRRSLANTPSFLMVARLLKAKGVREYAEAAISIKSRHPDIRFRLVGYFDEGPDAIARSDLENWVAAGLEYSGPLDDIRPAMAEASVYVLPSYHEGTPRSVLEAMAMGRPIITCDAPGCRETVRHGENGILVPIRDIVAVKEAMEQFIDSPNRIAPMGDVSFRIVTDKYEVTSVNRTLMELLDIDGDPHQPNSSEQS